MPQDALANQDLIAQYGNGDPNHLRNILVKLRKTNSSQKDRRQHLCKARQHILYICAELTRLTLRAPA